MILMGLCENKVLSYEVGVQGDASLRETLATPTWRHEFNPQYTRTKPSIPAVLVMPVLECGDKILGVRWRACLAETASFKVMKSLSQKTRWTVPDK